MIIRGPPLLILHRTAVAVPAAWLKFPSRPWEQSLGYRLGDIRGRYGGWHFQYKKIPRLMS